MMDNPISYNIDKFFCINNPKSCVKPTTCTTFHNSYKMYNYTDLKPSNHTDDSLYKSVVVDEHSHQIYCFSPPKSVPIQTFFMNKPSNFVLHSDTYLINEIVEGIMINLWYDSFLQKWEISTKNSVGGSEYLYEVVEGLRPSDQKTILSMFLEAIHCENDLHDHIQGMKCWKMAYSYHFILQHPQMIVYPPNTIQPHHPIVGFINSPTLYLVAIYHIRDDASTAFSATLVKYIPSSVFESWEELKFHWLLFPKRVATETPYKQLMEFYTSPYSEINSTGAGVMITDLHTGVRTKIVSEVFKKYRELRSNNTQWLFQYLCLNYIHRVDDFLQFYPCFFTVFIQYQKQYISLIRHIHHSYMDKYIRRTKNRNKQFEYDIDYLHNQVFLKYKMLDTNPKFIITVDVVKEYVHLLSPMYLMYLLDARTML